jgi:hypothetical protein
MPLTETCRRYVGRNLFVLPYYGYGWNRQDVAEPPKTLLDTLGPEPFHLRVGEIISDGRDLMALTGTIEETDHQFNDYWCACLLRNTDASDFTAKPGDYMIWIARKALPIHPAPYPEKALYHWVTFDKSVFCLCGFGTLAESVDWIQDIYKRTMNSRKRVKDQGVA